MVSSIQYSSIESKIASQRNPNPDSISLGQELS